MGAKIQVVTLLCMLFYVPIFGFQDKFTWIIIYSILCQTSGIMLGSLACRTNLLVSCMVTKSSGQKCLFRIKPQNQIFPQSKKKNQFLFMFRCNISCIFHPMCYKMYRNHKKYYGSVFAGNWVSLFGPVGGENWVGDGGGDGWGL